MVTYHHVDGMYSYCTIKKDTHEAVIHLSASTPLVHEKKLGYYRIANKREQPGIGTYTCKICHSEFKRKASGYKVPRICSKPTCQAKHRANVSSGKYNVS